MLMEEGIVLGHHISSKGIELDPIKIIIIFGLPSPQKQKDVRSLLGDAGYYRKFVKDFSKIASPMFDFLTKYANFKWNE